MDKELSEVQKKNIKWAIDHVAESVFYHNNDSTQKERLKDALTMLVFLLINMEKTNQTPNP